MYRVGLVCDMSYTRSISMVRYYYAITNLFFNTKIVNNSNDLEGLDILFIPDPSFLPHRQVWMHDTFINTCNSLNLRVVVCYGEKILNSVYPANLQIFNLLNSIKNLTYYLWDVDDSLYFNRKVIRYCPSKFYQDKIVKREKANKAIFIGQINTPHYAERRDVLNTINKYIETDIFDSYAGDWQDYLNVYSKYKYAICPLSGNYNGLPLRFYESLLAECIPIQQIRDNTLDVYSKESTFGDCIFFQDISELPKKLEELDLERSTNKVWLEDELLQLLNEDGFL